MEINAVFMKILLDFSSGQTDRQPNEFNKRFFVTVIANPPKS